MPNSCRASFPSSLLALSVSLLIWGGGAAHAQDGTAPANQPDAPVPAPAPQTPAEDEPKLGLTLGADLYYGASNLPGANRFRDGFWIGAGPYYPSNIYAIYNTENGISAKVSASVGKLYNGSVEGFDQPIEAYVSKSYGSATYTVGKFYMPFELLEYEYETEYGLQAAQDWGKKGSLTAALTYNRERDTPNGYLRYARTFGIATVGVSFGAGRGFIFDTDHNQGAALDVTLEHGRFNLESSAITARQSGEDSRFGFIFARLNYQLNPRAELYVSRHSWSDQLQQQGDGHYSTLGAVYHFNHNLALEGALARSGDQPRNTRWVQLHYTIER